MTERTPPTFVLGAGPVATSLASALRHAGVPVLGLWGRSEERVHAAAARAGIVGFAGAVPGLLREADVVVFAVRDDAVAEVARDFTAAGKVRRDAILLHCGGARSAARAFGAARELVRAIGTMHPLRSFVGGRIPPSLHGTAFALEGDAAATHLARLLVGHLGGFPYELSADALPLYHAGAALASNCLVVVFQAACEVLATAGIPRAEVSAALLPLARSAIDNLDSVGLPDALTGPIARGDGEAVERHLDALERGVPSLLELYRALARRAITIAVEKGAAGPEALSAIERILGADTVGSR